jgi:putative transposase
MSCGTRLNLPFMKIERYDEFMHNINTALAFDSNDKAKLKLRVIEVLDQYDWPTTQLVFPGISRASAYRWRKRYLESGKTLTSLIPHSTRPHRVKQMRVPAQILGFIKTLRLKYPKMSKYKIKIFLDEFCLKNQLPIYSVSWIGKVINRYQLFFNIRKPVKRKRRPNKNITRVKYCPKQKDLVLGYLQLDGIKVCFKGRDYCFLSGVELKSRQSWAKRVNSLASTQAQSFLKDILNSVKSFDYQIHTIQTDNGSEFKAYFDQALNQLQIKHLWSYPKSPQTNGYVERFNWTIQDEFVNYEIDTALADLSRFDQKLSDWLHYYNYIRPHQSLGYKTPIQVLQLLKDKN